MAGQGQVASLLSFTKLSKGIAIILVAGYVVQFAVPSSKEYIALVPGRYVNATPLMTFSTLVCVHSGAFVTLFWVLCIAGFCLVFGQYSLGGFWKPLYLE